MNAWWQKAMPWLARINSSGAGWYLGTVITVALALVTTSAAWAQSARPPNHSQFVHTSMGDQIIATTNALAGSTRQSIDARIQERHQAAFHVPAPPTTVRAVWYLLLYHRDRPDGDGRTYPSVEAATAVWFEVVPPPPPPPPPGQRVGDVRIEGRAFADDGGQFKGFGVTYFSALHWERADRGYLQANLDWLIARQVNYIRILSMVGRTDDPDDFWKGREIDPEAGGYFTIFDDLFADLRRTTPNNPNGLRAQVVLVDDVLAMQTQDDRLSWLNRMAPYLERHRDRVMFVEVMNESGRKISDRDLAQLTRHWKSISGIPVAPSSPGPGSAEESITELFRDHDLAADLLTPHFDRLQAEDGYRPHRQPWEVQFYDFVNSHAFVNNEPIGCGSTGGTDCDPARLAMGAANTFLSRGAGSLLHTRAGVRGDYPFWEELNAEAIMTALRGVMALLPETIANGVPCRHHWDCHPFVTEDEIWPDTGGDGVVRAFASEVDGLHYVAALGIRGGYPVEARYAMTVEVFDARDASQRLGIVQLHEGQPWTFRQDDQVRDYLLRISPR